MAFEEGLELRSATAGADLSAASNLFKAVKLDSNGTIVAVAATTDIPFGILYDTPKLGQPGPVATGGIVKCVAGATIAAGALVSITATGAIQTAVTGQAVIGTARTSAVSGDVFPVSIDTTNPWLHA